MKAWLKSLIGPVIFLAVITVALVILVKNMSPAEEEEIIDIRAFASEEESFVLENEYLKLEMDALTTQFSVTVKETGDVWYSNPVDAAEDTIALTAEKGKNQSTLLLTYSNKTGIDVQLNNYDYSIAKGIYEIEADDTQIRINYSIGDVQKEYKIPPVIEDQYFSAYTDKMEGGQFVRDYYKKYDEKAIAKIKDEDEKAALLERYPALAEGKVLRILRDTTTDALKAKFQMQFEEVGYTDEDWERDKALDTGIVVSDKPVFNASLIIKLDGRDLLATVPFDSLEGKSDLPIYEISILPMFGAGNRTAEGWMFVPEGGGALINMNNGKLAQNAYVANVYGWDMCLDRDYVINETKAEHPIFGECLNGSSYLCFLEDGASYAYITADIAGKKNSYNTVNSSHRVYQRDEYHVADRVGGRMLVYQNELPLEECMTNRYRFYGTDSYVDLAKGYRDYVFNRFPGEFEMRTDTSTPVVVEVLNAVDKITQVLGVPTDKPWLLTTFDQTQEILTDMKANGMNNMYAKLLGWSNDGVQQTILTDIDTVSDVGSKKDLDNLSQFAKDNNIKLYLNGITNYAIDSGIFDGFWSFSDAARYITKERAELYRYRIVTYVKEDDLDDPYYLLTPENIGKMVDNFTEYATERGTGVCFQDFGNEISSDFARDKYVSRETSKKQISKKLSEIEKTGLPVMINGGSAYALPYADIVADMNLAGSDYSIFDEEIPFVQLAFHGYVNYTGEALNLTQNKSDELLKSVEYGAGLMFNVMNETAFALQKTRYTDYFGSEYASAKPQIFETYTRYNKELGHIFNQEMVNHELLTDTLTCTTYADGTKVYVNFDYLDSTTPDGTVIPARDYKVIR